MFQSVVSFILIHFEADENHRLKYDWPISASVNPRYMNYELCWFINYNGSVICTDGCENAWVVSFHVNTRFSTNGDHAKSGINVEKSDCLSRCPC